MRKLCLILLLALMAAGPARAQIYTLGSDAPHLRWRVLRSGDFKLIYPEACDSMAREYAKSLESYRAALKGSLGMAPNEFYKRPMPVVLRANSAISNGMVTWAPRRMELYTTPESDDPESTPWIDQLAVHEGRHVAQLQAGRLNPLFKTGEIFVGQLMTGAVSALYPGPALLEGDAVVAETALSNTGRGRTADFLEYWHVALSQGRFRDYWQWRWGSQKRYTPDYYRAGYVLVAGMRTAYDPLFMNRYYHRIAWKQLPILNLQKTVRESSGLKFKHAFQGIQEHFAREWAKADSLRGPFVEGEDFTRRARLYDSYRSLTFLHGEIYAIHGGIDRSTELVRLDSTGRARVVRPFSGQTSRLSADEKGSRLFWSEVTPSKHFDLLSYSRICYLDSLGKVHKLTCDGRRYNPVHAPDSARVATVRYYEDGRASVEVLDSYTGEVLDVVFAPDGLQPVELAWLDGRLYASGIVREGFGIWTVDGWTPVLAPAHSKINRLFSHNGRLWFNSDRSGVNELHSLDPAGTALLQHSNTRYGAGEFAFSPSGSIYYSAPTLDGRVVRKLPADSLLNREVDFGGYQDSIADALSAQEDLSLIDGSYEPGESKSYRRGLLRNVRPHSWAPLYIDYNPIEQMSIEEVESPGGIGAMAMFQNELGTSYGSVGVSLFATRDTLGTGDQSLWMEYRPSLHAQYIWTGWGPIIEARADYNERNAHHSQFTSKTDGSSISFTPFSEVTAQPLLRINAAISYPYDFSSRGWKRGVIPSARFSWTNDRYTALKISNDDNKVWYGISPYTVLSRLSLRGYVMRPTPQSCIYPRLGIGAEAGVTESLWLRSTYPGYWFASAYGYLPGFMSTHGLRLQADFQTSQGGHWTKTTSYGARADYVFPFAPVDWSFLGPVAYIRNFEGALHAAGSYTGTKSCRTGDIVSEESVLNLGASLRVRLSNFLWIPYDIYVGAKYTYSVTHPGMSGFEAVFSADI